jgi:Co/Zn/Cd efflux system component
VTNLLCVNNLFFRYVRAEVLAGFVNALFLLFIGFFILSEAFEVNKKSNSAFRQ